MVKRQIVDLEDVGSNPTFPTMKDLIKETILLLGKLREALFSGDVFGSGLTEEEFDNDEIERLLVKVNRNVDKILEAFENGNLVVNPSRYVDLMRSIINVNTRYHGDANLTDENKILHKKLMGSLERMNNLIVRWNKLHDDHIPTLKDVRKMINEEIERGWQLLKDDLRP